MQIHTAPVSSRRAAAALVLLLAAWTACDREPGTRVARVDTGHLRQQLQELHGRPVLLVFWATWCQPCIQEVPELTALHHSAPEGLRILAVSLDALSSNNDQASTRVAQFLRSTPMPYGQFLYVGPPEPLVEAYQLPGNIPFAILYDADGKVLRRYEGRVSGDTIRAALAAARNG